MAINLGGKPGSRYVLGIQRAQLVKANAMAQSLIKFNTKWSAAHAPLKAFTDAQAVVFANMALTCQQILAQKN